MSVYYYRIGFSDGRLTARVEQAKLMHRGEVTYISKPGEHGWRRHTGPLFDDPGRARGELIFELRRLAAEASLAIESILEVQHGTHEVYRGGGLGEDQGGS